MLRAAPDIYIVGNQPEYATQVVDTPTHKIRIVLVPRFDAAQTAVLLDLDTLECEPVSFRL